MRTKLLASALLLGLVSFAGSALALPDTCAVMANGKKIGEIIWTENATRGSKAEGFGGARLIGGYKTTDAAAESTADCAQLRWVQTITTNCPLGGATSPYVDPHPNPDPPSPFYWDDTAATSGARYDVARFRGKDGYTLKYEDLPGRGFALCPLPVTWCAELCLVCVRDDGTIVPLKCFSWGFIVNADSTTTLKPVTTLTFADSMFVALKRDFPARTVGIPIRRGVNRVRDWPYAPGDSLALVNDTGRKQCDVWIHTSHVSEGDNPLDRVRITGKNWTIVHPTPDPNGDIQPPAAWIKAVANTQADCLDSSEYVFVRLGGGPNGTSAHNREVRIYPTNERQETIVSADRLSPGDPFYASTPVPVEDLAMGGMVMPGEFSAATVFGTPGYVEAVQFSPDPYVDLFDAGAYLANTNTQIGVYDGFGRVQFFSPVPPDQEIDIVYYFDSTPLLDTTAPEFVMHMFAELAPGSTDDPRPGRPFGLRAVFPNPTPAGVTVQWELPRAETVDVRILDVRGALVASPARGLPAGAGPGSLVWNGRGDDGRPVPGGLYLVSFRAGETRSSKKVLVVR